MNMTASTLLLEPVAQSDCSVPLPINGFHVEPRCRVCRNDAIRRKVNEMLTTGASYAMVLRALAGENDRVDKRDQVTIDSIRNHTSRHFPVQNAAKATYRAILEHRAKENAVDFVNGVSTAITPMAFLETVMAKSYETLLDSDTKVDVSTGVVAANRLQALIDSRAGQANMIEMWVKMDRIINAVHSLLPKELWPEMLRMLDGVDVVDHQADERHDCDDADCA